MGSHFVTAEGTKDKAIKKEKKKTKEFSIKDLFGVYTYIELFKHMNTRRHQSVSTQPTPTRGDCQK